MTKLALQLPPQNRGAEPARGGAGPGRWGAVLLPALLFALSGGCRQGGGGPPPAPAQVEVAKAVARPVAQRLAAVGTLLPNEQVTVMPESAGRIRTIAFEEGQRVEAGTLLFELAPEKQAAQLAQAEVDLKLARDNAERIKKLAGTRAISQQEVDRVLSLVTSREAALALQQERLKDFRIVAPFAGVLGPRAVSVGQFVNVGARLVTLTDDAKVKVVYDLPERHLASLRVGQEVSVRLAAFGERAFPGRVALINPQVDEATRTIEVRALVDNPERLLRPGMFAHVETVVGTRPDAVVVPEKALVPSLEGFAVYAIQKTATNEVARLTQVKVGQRLPGEVEIREGLAAGQRIVVGGVQKIFGDGAPVAPVPTGAATAGATNPPPVTSEPEPSA